MDELDHVLAHGTPVEGVHMPAESRLEVGKLRLHLLHHLLLEAADLGADGDGHGLAALVAGVGGVEGVGGVAEGGLGAAQVAPELAQEEGLGRALGEELGESAASVGELVGDLGQLDAFQRRLFGSDGGGVEADEFVALGVLSRRLHVGGEGDEPEAGSPDGASLGRVDAGGRGQSGGGGGR